MDSKTTELSAQKRITTTLRSFDDVIKSQKEGGDPLLKAEKEADLSAAVSKAKVESIKALGAYEAALTTRGHDIGAAVLALEKASKTYEFYTELYAQVFPNG